MSRYWTIAVCLLSLFFTSCAIIPLYSHSNKKTDRRSRFTQQPEEKVPSGAYLASYDVKWDLNWECRNKWKVTDSNVSLPTAQCARDDENFVAIAISGGGSRSAIFSAAVFFELERYGILQQADVISSVTTDISKTGKKFYYQMDTQLVLAS